ncbi:hypothetical protein EfmJHP9_13260 [Enterococcus faecium]|nr:hypothetical protein EfmJHP9_13260 [Enterococcus faecium]
MFYIYRCKENENQMVIRKNVQVDFIYVPLDNTIANAMQTVVKEANKANIPVIPSVDTMVHHTR